MEAGAGCKGFVFLAKFEGDCYRSSRANHFAGSNTDREAGSAGCVPNPPNWHSKVVELMVRCTGKLSCFDVSYRVEQHQDYCSSYSTQPAIYSIVLEVRRPSCANSSTTLQCTIPKRASTYFIPRPSTSRSVDKNRGRRVSQNVVGLIMRC